MVGACKACGNKVEALTIGPGGLCVECYAETPEGRSFACRQCREGLGFDEARHDCGAPNDSF